MRRRHPRSTLTDTLCPYTTLFRSWVQTSTFSSLARNSPTALTFDLATFGSSAPGVLHRLHCGATVQSVKKPNRSEEHTFELQLLMRNSYAVVCLKKQNPAQHEQIVFRHLIEK